MNECDFRAFLYERLGDDPISSVKTFSEAGLLTANEGLVVRTKDGREFQITIVQSR